jgi:hypothetical protein
MGRPLKIAKAQAVLTITDTAETGGVVTVTENLTTAPTVGVLAGMPFVVASTVGGLTANTVYYILAITGNHTFTVSSTQLSVQPQVSPTLSDTTGQSVKATVAPVDVYFNNPVSGAGFPATNSNTYSIVGGNTAIVGPQVLANVAFGVEGQGRVIADTGSNIVVGYGTDFANIATGTHLYAHWGDDPTSQQLLGTTTSTAGDLTVAVANTQNTGNIIGTSGNAQTLVEGGPVTFSANLGGLVTGTTYWVLNVANASAFTVSATPNGAEVDLSNATGTPDAVQQQVVLAAVSANNATGTNGTGDTFITALPEAGYIVRQKGKQKYLVTGTVTGLTGPCYLANVANTALTPNTMRVLATYANSATQTAQNLSDHNGLLFTATSGPVATGNIVLANATPVTLTFNTAEAANTYGGQPLPIVTIASA